MWQVRPTSKSNLLTTADGGKWQLTQFHFHTPSENAFDGRHAAMEAHLVHTNVATGACLRVWRQQQMAVVLAAVCSARSSALDRVEVCMP
jgi:carbonic anhydrase